MKFLCVPCNEPMKLGSTRMDEPGSVSLVYACPACGYEFALLTNAHETQVVSSLGVELGSGKTASRCPFTGVVRELEGAGARGEIAWTPGAEARLAGVPPLVKSFVRAGIEQYARDHGYTEVTEGVLDEARGVMKT